MYRFYFVNAQLVLSVEVSAYLKNKSFPHEKNISLKMTMNNIEIVLVKQSNDLDRALMLNE